MEKKLDTIRSPCIQINQTDKVFYLTKLPASALTQISYAAIRGQTDEEGAVQRMLNPSRITSIKNFVLQGGDFPNALILNWVSINNKIEHSNNFLIFTIDEHSAQIIDGQHRIAGIRSAIATEPSIGKLELPVVIYQNLSTKQCADIFLSINTEQKPAPRSLVFDLYGIASSENVDPAAVRARDIAMSLNEEEQSPYRGQMKLPGAPTRKGGIALSTAVSAIKPLVEEKGVFEQIDVVELQGQRQVIFNFFKALQENYKDKWWDRSNVFMYAAGFTGAIDFLKLKLIPYCSTKESITIKTISESLELLSDRLILQDEVKGLGGKDAPKKIFDRLVECFSPQKNKRKIEII